jgi:hypothetical protein
MAEERGSHAIQVVDPGHVLSSTRSAPRSTAFGKAEGAEARKTGAIGTVWLCCGDARGEASEE